MLIFDKRILEICMHDGQGNDCYIRTCAWLYQKQEVKSCESSALDENHMSSTDP